MRPTPAHYEGRNTDTPEDMQRVAALEKAIEHLLANGLCDIHTAADVLRTRGVRLNDENAAAPILSGT